MHLRCFDLAHTSFQSIRIQSQTESTRDLILLSVTFLASVRFRCCRCYSTPLHLIQDNHGSYTRLHISDVIDIIKFRNSLPMFCHWLFRSLFAEGQAGGRCVIRQNHVPNTKTREGCYKQGCYSIWTWKTRRELSDASHATS
jgi:hypothetical protein